MQNRATFQSHTLQCSTCLTDTKKKETLLTKPFPMSTALTDTSSKSAADRAAGLTSPAMKLKRDTASSDAIKIRFHFIQEGAILRAAFHLQGTMKAIPSLTDGLQHLGHLRTRAKATSPISAKPMPLRPSGNIVSNPMRREDNLMRPKFFRMLCRCIRFLASPNCLLNFTCALDC